MALMTNEVHKVLLNKARRDGLPLDRESTMTELRERFGESTLNAMPWGDMFMMDMMFVKEGGDYRCFEYDWPHNGDTVLVGGVEHIVYGRGLFTFQAEPL